MSACSSSLEVSEQLCYVRCGFCTTILLVSVPCSSLSKVVTVRCGHCQGLLSVDMRSVPLVPLQFLSSHGDDERPMQQKREHSGDDLIRSCDGLSGSVPTDDHGGNKEAAEEEEEEEEEADVAMNTDVSKPPEKRQRAPSAYNCFIKEEIKRIKGRDPSITHKEAFSTAAKNWAHFPRIQQKGDGESGGLGVDNLSRDGVGAEEMQGEGYAGFHMKKIPRHSMHATATFK